MFRNRNRRRVLRQMCTGLLLSTAVGILPIMGQAQNAVVEGTVHRDLEYAPPDGKPLLLDLYLPEGTPEQRYPVVVWVHGGGWNQGSKRNCPARWLTGEGFAVASINYRLSQEGRWPAQIEDCRAAVGWLRRNAHRYHLAPERVGAWGGSAGGHLAALMGTLPCPEPVERVQAVCDWYGPSDLLTMPNNVLSPGKTTEQLARTNGAQLLGGTVRDLPEKAKQASAYHQVSKGDAPFLIMHGDADPQVPLEQSVKLHEALQRAGVESSLQVLPGAGHGGPAFNTPAARTQIREFFSRHLRLRSEK